jgi:antitoxin component of RelBE/YafQ-DinJ toxin-antitoxin module
MGKYKRETCDEQVMSRITSTERAAFEPIALDEGITVSAAIRVLIKKAIKRKRL